jgi:hypothetical protein
LNRYAPNLAQAHPSGSSNGTSSAMHTGSPFPSARFS